MKRLSEKEMKNISAGAISAGGWALIAACVSFLAGVIDGYTRPYKCR